MAKRSRKKLVFRAFWRRWAGPACSRGMAVAGFILLSTLLDVGSASAATWRNHTNVNRAVDLYPQGDTVWAATSGGLTVFAGDEVATLTNADGLGDNDLQFVTADENGRLWTGGPAGRLSSFDPATGEWDFYDFVDQDGRPLRLNAAAADGNFLWVGSKIGVHKFDMEHLGGEIKETYRRLGELPADEEVRSVLLAGNHIWVATSSGCATARTDDINLQDYSHWRSFSTDNSGLQHQDVASLAADAGRGIRICR
jgi:ligand-binding sensor domain-containing protein